MTDKEKFKIIADRIKKAGKEFECNDEYGFRRYVSLIDNCLYCFKEYDKDYLCYTFNQDDFDFDFFVEHFGYPFKSLLEDLGDD